MASASAFAAQPPLPGSGSGSGSAPSGIVRQITVESFAVLLRDQGYKAEIVRRETSSFIRTGVSGRKVTVFFYDCRDTGCGSFQYRMYFESTPQYTLELANTWNRDSRYGKAYLDKDKDYNLEWDVDLDGGVTTEYIMTTIKTFEKLVARFDKALP